MSDYPIPAPASWNKAEAHAAQDELAEWACDNPPRVGRLDREDIDAAIRERCMPTEAASACTEIGAEPAHLKRRLGPLTRIERRLLRRTPTYTWALIVALSIGCFVQWVRS